MSELDEKLREILYKVGAHNADAIPEIKQAFADAGYSKQGSKVWEVGQDYMTSQDKYEAYQRDRMKRAAGIDS